MNTQNHTSLYRKYRPSGFDQVIGQDHVVGVLKSVVERKKPNHAYLFTGTRGVGKTSIARIFAKALGVEQEDIYEIDAASYTGVDNIRELTESAMTLPFRSPYKIYILDEVHMLSKSAFNAFLKGLEEPPKHVIYILATTELGKLPDTIISRCEVHNFKTPTVDTLTQVVKNTAKQEGYSISDGTAKVIALSGDGSFRDALGSLQKVLDAVSGKTVEESDVERVLGVPKMAIMDDLVLAAIDNKDVLHILDTLRKVYSDGKVVYDLYVEKLRERLRTDVPKKERIVELLTKALQEYRHLRFVDPMIMLEVVTV